MNAYSIFLFFHIVGALGLFVALGLEWTGLWQLRNSSTPEHLLAWMVILKNTRKFGLASMLATVISGIYLMVTAWGAAPWLIVTLGALVLVIAITQALTAPQMTVVGQALAAGKGTLSETFHSLANHPILFVSIQTRVAIALGIVLLKVAKPDFGGSLLTIAVVILLGIASVIPLLRHSHRQQMLTH